MHTSVGTQVELGFNLFVFFVLAPCVAATIGYAAWKGKPKSFDREMYWTTFVSTAAVAGLIIVYALRHGGTWPRLAQLPALVWALSFLASPLDSESGFLHGGEVHCLISVI
jgi:hypothetical protein